jgi:hypothetical protein
LISTRLYYTQDPEITNFVVGKADKDNKVTVKFKNFGKDREIMFSLAKKTPRRKSGKLRASFTTTQKTSPRFWNTR